MSKPEEQMALANVSTDRAVVTLESAPVGEMLQGLLKAGITPESVGVAERLMGLYERMQEKDAERKFATAFVNLQADMPAIQASRPVPNNDGTIRYKFAPYEDIMAAVKPVLEKHGFTLTFSMDIKEQRVIQTCTLQHIGGHKRSNNFMARIGRGPPGSSEAQGDGAASTYAKRFALCDCLNISIERDGDARAEGEFIGADQIQYLREQLVETQSPEAAFFKLAGVSKFEEIGTEKYDILVRALESRKRR